jgi:hypothetical protein
MNSYVFIELIGLQTFTILLYILFDFCGLDLDFSSWSWFECIVRNNFLNGSELILILYLVWILFVEVIQILTKNVFLKGRIFVDLIQITSKGDKETEELVNMVVPQTS